MDCEHITVMGLGITEIEGVAARCDRKGCDWEFAWWHSDNPHQSGPTLYELWVKAKAHELEAHK